MLDARSKYRNDAVLGFMVSYLGDNFCSKTNVLRNICRRGKQDAPAITKLLRMLCSIVWEERFPTTMRLTRLP